MTFVSVFKKSFFFFLLCVLLWLDLIWPNRASSVFDTWLPFRCDNHHRPTYIDSTQSFCSLWRHSNRTLSLERANSICPMKQIEIKDSAFYNTVGISQNSWVFLLVDLLERLGLDYETTSSSCIMNFLHVNIPCGMIIIAIRMTHPLNQQAEKSGTCDGTGNLPSWYTFWNKQPLMR